MPFILEPSHNSPIPTSTSFNSQLNKCTNMKNYWYLPLFRCRYGLLCLWPRLTCASASRSKRITRDLLTGTPIALSSDPLPTYHLPRWITSRFSRPKIVSFNPLRQASTGVPQGHTAQGFHEATFNFLEFIIELSQVQLGEHLLRDCRAVSSREKFKTTRNGLSDLGQGHKVDRCRIPDLRIHRIYDIDRLTFLEVRQTVLM